MSCRAYFGPGLFAVLSRLKGYWIGKWRVTSLFAIGGYGVIYRVEGPNGEEGLMKMVNLPYNAPDEMDHDEVASKREELRFEAHVLQRFPNSLLPGLLDIVNAQNPLIPAGIPLQQVENCFLVMENIPGIHLDRMVQQWQEAGRSKYIRDHLHVWMDEILAFLVLLKGKGYFYVDFKPSNLLVNPDTAGLRIIDAGSVVSMELSNRDIPLSEGYHALNRGARIQGGPDLETISLCSLGRTLYATLLNRELHEGYDFDFSPLGTTYGKGWEQFIRGLALSNIRTFQECRQELIAIGSG